VSITLHGVTRSMPIPLAVDAEPGEWIVSGAFRLNQTDFGIVPLSLLGGAIEVQDAIDLRFRIRAVRMPR
jgi:polyisoprenoid-binding protein YceI